MNWQVAIDSLKYTIPSDLHHEVNFPQYQQHVERWRSFMTLLYGDAGEKMDINAEIDKLQADLLSIAKGTFPTSTPVPTATPAPK